MSGGCTVGEIKQEVEKQIQTTGGSITSSDFALFPSIDKLIVNASPPLEPHVLLLTLEHVKNTKKKHFLFTNKM